MKFYLSFFGSFLLLILFLWSINQNHGKMTLDRRGGDGSQAGALAKGIEYGRTHIMIWDDLEKGTHNLPLTTHN